MITVKSKKAFKNDDVLKNSPVQAYPQSIELNEWSAII